LWYGFFFALGFFIGYFLLVYLLKGYFDQDHIKVKKICEKALVYAVFGVIIGARLGDLLFYQQGQDLLEDPLLLIRVWEGGLASHGGALGLIIAFLLFFIKNRSLLAPLSFLRLLDCICLPASVICGCIRIGNFFNQEILGTKTTVFWGVVCMHPADASAIAVRHPVQLYEAFFYFLVAVCLWKTRKQLTLAKPGQILGFFLLGMFGFRIGIEFFKEEQSLLLSQSSFLTMGQILSIPLFLMGLWLVFLKKSSCEKSS
jgi:prolipoprotein diacylglyceryl transferase